MSLLAPSENRDLFKPEKTVRQNSNPVDEQKLGSSAVYFTANGWLESPV
ncbi:MAG: hypothetical protein FWD08_02195 [Alphaproteobacteria bacterium]|nr:hypothetical protein [Alphaproteobacteria bacterium]MCL2452455.1 hypothetical protein [Alphaproteobacteria bacterium]